MVRSKTLGFKKIKMVRYLAMIYLFLHKRLRF